MQKYLPIDMLAQPNDTTCGPTSLHAVYGFYGDKIGLEQVIKEVKQLNTGGTLAVLLGNHALNRGYKATIYTYKLQIFDPTWFSDEVDIKEKLTLQLAAKPGLKMQFATQSYLNFLENGGKLKYRDLTPSLLRSYLNKHKPILTGLSSTYLYGTKREIGDTNEYNDIAGTPAGHFVVVHGYNKTTRKISVADPLYPNPFSDHQQYYEVGIYRLINAILLGIVTYDANLLIIEPR